MPPGRDFSLKDRGRNVRGSADGAAGPAAVSHPSGASIADGHGAAIDDDGYVPPPVAVGEHFVEEGAVLDDVPVLHVSSFGAVGLTGLDRVGSTGLAVDDDGICHGVLLFDLVLSWRL